jgi:hypothetical protein
MIGAIGAGICAPALLIAAANAEEQPGRYTMTPTDGGFVRLDKQTGAMSFCSGKEGDWNCKPMPDSQQQLQSHIDELERENKTLKEHGPADGPEAGIPGDTVPPVPPGNLQVPNEEDVDKLFDYVEGMVKKFKERIQRLERETQKDTPL